MPRRRKHARHQDREGDQSEQQYLIDLIALGKRLRSQTISWAVDRISQDINVREYCKEQVKTERQRWRTAILKHCDCQKGVCSGCRAAAEILGL